MKEKNKKTVWIVIVILLIAIFFVARNIVNRTLEMEENSNATGEIENISDNEDSKEMKLSKSSFVTYQQAANDNSYIKSLTVNVAENRNVEFMIGELDEDLYITERIHFEVFCQKGENTIDLLDQKYLIKTGEYLFMKVSNQDVLYEQKNQDVLSWVETDENNRTGKMKVTKSNFVLPFKYSLEKVQTYRALVIGNDITTKNGGAGLLASDNEHDYYTLTKIRLENMFETVNINRINATQWEENNRLGENRTTWINKNLSKNTISNLDLVIFQLGDNYNKDDDLETGMKELVDYVRQYSPNAEMIWIGLWKVDEKRQIDLPGICERLNVEFINISDLVTPDYQAFLQPRTENTNLLQPELSALQEVFYPNNEAMQIISNRIIEKLKFDF